MNEIVNSVVASVSRRNGNEYVSVLNDLQVSIYLPFIDIGIHRTTLVYIGIYWHVLHLATMSVSKSYYVAVCQGLTYTL